MEERKMRGGVPVFKRETVKPKRTSVSVKPNAPGSAKRPQFSS